MMLIFKKNRKELFEIKNVIIQIKSSVAVLENNEQTSQKINQKGKKRKQGKDKKDGSPMSS